MFAALNGKNSVPQYRAECWLIVHMERGVINQFLRDMNYFNILSINKIDIDVHIYLYELIWQMYIAVQYD